MKQYNPLVSIVMNCYNGEKFLKEAIESIYNQTYTNWEIIFWDNCSIDNSAKIAKSFGSKLKYNLGESNLKLGEARNKALKKCKGDLIAFLDVDDLWFKDKLEKQVPLFMDSNVGLVFSDTYFFNEAGEQSRFYAKKKYWEGNCFSRLLTDYFISLETVIISHKALKEQNYYFDPRFNLIEEADLFRRISYSWKIAMINEPLAKWRVHSDSWTWKNGNESYRETLNMLESYSYIFPGFENNFKKEINTLMKKVSFNDAMFHWKNGNSALARKRLFPFILKDHRSFLIYFASFVSNNSMQPFFKIFKKNITPNN